MNYNTATKYPLNMALVLILLCLSAAVVSADLNADYSNNAYLDELQTYKLYWKLDDAKQRISFAVEVTTLGWVGFGISSGKGNMAGADIVIGWVDENQGYLKDRYAKSESLPKIDDKQDYELEGAYEKDGKTVLKFSRKYDTCDERDRVIEDGTVRVIYAYHADDPSSEDEMSKHTTRGSQSLLLRNILTQKPKLPDDLEHFDMRVNASLPDDDTTYYCKSFQMPHFNGTKKHIVKISPIISPGHRGLVHHILVYGCEDEFPVANVSVAGPCHSHNMPDPMLKCLAQSVVAAWAIGGGDFYFPDHVGYPIGDDLSIKFVVMEVHYDNPDKKSGITDHSGLRFHYTAKHRQYDASVLWVGWAVSYRMWVPPKEAKWNSVGYCSSNCTHYGLQDSPLDGGGIKIFASILHSHLLGAALWTKHIRNGKELPNITHDEHYDFNFQEFQVFKEERHVLPGDEIVQYCQYDSTGREKVTMGGLSTKEEMCLSYMYYYPRMNFSKCVSKSYAVDDFYVTYYKRTNKTFDWKNAKWDKQEKQELMEAYDKAIPKSICQKHKGEPLYPATGQKYPKPVITEPYVQTNRCPRYPRSTSAINKGIQMMVIASAMVNIALAMLNII